MKNLKKIFALIVVLTFTLFLTSCKKPDKTVLFAFYDVKDPDVLVVDELTVDKKVDGVTVYHYFKAETHEPIDAEPLEVYFTTNGEEWSSEFTEEAIAKKYVYDFGVLEGKKGQTYEIDNLEVIQVKRNHSVNDYKVLYVDYLEHKDAKIVSDSLVLRDTYILETEGYNFYELTNKGAKKVEFTKEDLVNETYPNAELDSKGKDFINNETYDVKIKDTDYTFKVRLAAQYKPIHKNTASFWNWIFLQMPIAYFMAFISSLFNNSFAMGIIITTIVVRTLAWPIYAKSNDMSMKMNLAQPDIDRLNQKYATRKDPESQQKMQMEMMQLYKKHNINMFGCLLPFLQMPIFFAMFQVVRRITIPGGQFYEKVSNTKFLLTDLDNPGFWAKMISTVLVGLTMFLLQKVSQAKPSYAKESPVKNKSPEAQQTEQTMKMVSFFMIFMMIMTSYVTPGLALSYYWIIGNIFSIGQTLVNKYINEKKFKKAEEEKLYGRSREIIDAEFKKKGDK